MSRRLISQISLLVAVFFLSVAMQSYASQGGARRGSLWNMQQHQNSIFREPAKAPPYGGAAAPLTTSGTAEAKLGGLILGIGNVATGLIVQHGNVGIGTSNPTQKLDVNGSVRSNTKVMSPKYCDQNGNNCIAPNNIASNAYVNSKVNGLAGGRPMTIVYSQCNFVSAGNFRRASCPSGKVMTSIQSGGIGCNGYCVSFSIECCKLSLVNSSGSGSTIDLNNYASKAYVNSKVNGLASKAYVNSKVGSGSSNSNPYSNPYSSWWENPVW